jgi:hypothetical protein
MHVTRAIHLNDLTLPSLVHKSFGFRYCRGLLFLQRKGNLSMRTRSCLQPRCPVSNRADGSKIGDWNTRVKRHTSSQRPTPGPHCCFRQPTAAKVHAVALAQGSEKGIRLKAHSDAKRHVICGAQEWRSNTCFDGIRSCQAAKVQVVHNVQWKT